MLQSSDSPSEKDSGDDGMRESGCPRHLGLEGQDDPSKTIWRSLAQLKASVESLDPIALSKK